MTDMLIGVFGVAAFVCALLVVALRQPMRAALALIAHMVCLAALFACLAVDIVALFQVLIYVGAVMLAMVYTIMLLDDQDTSYVHLFSRWLVPAIAVVAATVVALGLLLGVESAPVAPAATAAAPLFTFSAFSASFMERYWFHFELATVLLVIAIVAAWVVISEHR
jgi:NADH-quinone oxidoreductase subunit J